MQKPEFKIEQQHLQYCEKCCEQATAYVCRVVRGGVTVSCWLIAVWVSVCFLRLLSSAAGAT